jgi:hypothetical protein
LVKRRRIHFDEEIRQLTIVGFQRPAGSRKSPLACNKSMRAPYYEAKPGRDPAPARAVAGERAASPKRAMTSDCATRREDRLDDPAF